MTNADKYGMDEDELNELTDKFEKWHKNNTDVRGYGEALYRFLQAKVKPTLTEDEKVILRNVDKKYFAIGRKDGSKTDILLYLVTDDDKHCLCLYNHLFQFIQPRRRI